jgi:hypothetical protein
MRIARVTKISSTPGENQERALEKGVKRASETLRHVR